ncbi:uncharacterized protein LOC110245708 [Exaiptasia diaphana]|uniref:Uncharacterized protein n=1 Tax=Exaiptasia diaphana TaxID=2652724 RepID=A0A913XQI5_EXADI|nr:uncharacterized protein LOC110245708 [Exaiptasia diaphana]KXJ10266.1 hypothetical protein AC249_AIPGENE14533 [Exaiptasia diaphana]
MSWGRHKDWTTTMREARTRSVPANLPSNLKEYFNKSIKTEANHSRPSSTTCEHPHGSTYQAENGRVRDRRREAFLHVSRNNPHPFRIHFPFQTGDRLSTYMVWLPMERNIDATPSLPKIHNPNKSRALPFGNNGNAHTKKLSEKYNNPSTPLSTYQAEIASIPLLKHRVMSDHFPSLSKGRSLVYAGH